MGNGLVLETERLILREMGDADFADVAAMMQDPRVMYAWEYVFSDDEVREWIARMRTRCETYGYAYFLAVEKHSGRVAGQIGILPCKIHGTPQIGIGYILKYGFQGRGYAFEGARSCMEYAFRNLHTPFAVADIRPENSASLAVARKLGLTLRDEIVKLVRGKTMPHLVFAKDSPLVRVVPYHEVWRDHFALLKEKAETALKGIPVRIEHVGSTAVPGLAAKDVIDADIIPDDWTLFPGIAERLASAGWRHRGDLGIPGREAFESSLRLPFAHHLYVCRAGNSALENHLRLRAYLRSHPAAAATYGALKQQLAARFPEDIARYCEEKSALIAEMLAASGMNPDTVAEIRTLNTMSQREQERTAQPSRFGEEKTQSGKKNGKNCSK